MQPYLLPYIGYFQLINIVDTFVIFDDVNYIRKGWINRNRILCGGKDLLFTVSLKGASQFKLINETEIGSNNDKILKTLKQLYQKAPYFFETYPLVHDIMNYKESNLAKFVSNSIYKVAAHLGISTQFVLSSALAKDNSLRGKEKIIHICKLLGASQYINLKGGMKLYDKNDFKERGIELSFIVPSDITYKQFSNTFVPWLSIVDVLMFNSKEAINLLLNQYVLI
jgi:hypothetical protein